MNIRFLFLKLRLAIHMIDYIERFKLVIQIYDFEHVFERISYKIQVAAIHKNLVPINNYY